MTQGNGQWGGQPPPGQQPPQQQQYPQQPPQGQQPPPQQQSYPQQQPPQQGAYPVSGAQQPGGYPQQPPQGYQQPPQPDYNANPFAGLTSGDPTGQRHPFLLDGAYKLRLNAIKFKQSRGGKALYIIESDVVESNNPERPAGLRCSSFIDMSNMDTRGRHIASFTASVYGVDPETLPKESPLAPWTDPQTNQQMGWDWYAMQSIHESQPWANRDIGCFVQTVTTQAGKPFSLHTWVPIDKMVVPAAAAQPQQQQAPQGFQAPAAQQYPPQQQQAPQQGGPPNQGNWPPQGS